MVRQRCCDGPGRGGPGTIAAVGVRATFGPAVAAVPGQAAHFELQVENDGTQPEDVRIVLGGDSAGWGWAIPAALVVRPLSTATVTVTVKLPSIFPPPPGPLPFDVFVVPVDRPGEPVAATGTLDVAPSVALVATLRPHTSEGRAAGRHRLVVENRGNVPVTATVEGRGEDVDVQVGRAALQVDPGQEAGTDVVARLSGRAFRTGTATRPFEVAVRPQAGGGPPLATVEGVAEFPAGGAVRRLGAAIVLVALTAVALGAVIQARSGSQPGPEAEGTSEAAAGGPGFPDCPGRDHVSPDANGTVRAGVQAPFDYSFLFVSQDGCQPARFNPCAPIRYVLNRALATDADVADLNEAMAKVTEATGLEFQYAGTSTDDPRNVSPPGRAPDGSYTWPPVIIGWAHLGNGDVLRPSTTAGAQAASPVGVVGGGGRPLVVNNVITTGNLVLNLDAVTDTDTRNPVPHGFGPGVNWGRIMMHELAHVIGLGHVVSRTSIMNETLTQQTISSVQWGIGDLTGLRYLGKEGGCVTVPTVPVRGGGPA